MENVSRKTLLCGLFVCIGLAILTYIHRNPTGDDAWFAEQAYWLEKTGIVRSNFFSGVLGWDTQLLVSHKLFLLFGAGLVRLFGDNLIVFQLVGLNFFILLIAQIIAYVQNREQTAMSWNLLALLLLIFTNRLLIKMSFENRPELMLAALGFGSFLCINAVQSSRDSHSSRRGEWKWAALAGLLAGMAMLTHLNGVVYLMAGFITLLYLRQVGAALVFGLAGGLTGLLYFADVLMVENGFAIWFYQFRNDPATQNAFGLSAKLWVMLTYPSLFFQTPEVMALPILLIILLLRNRRYLRQLPQPLVIYSLALLASFWLITKKNSGLYTVLFIPFMLLFVYELYRLRPLWDRPVKVALAAYLVIGLYGTVEIIYKNITQPYLPHAYAELRSRLPNHATGLVPLTFFFNEYDEHPYLVSYDSYHFQYKPAQYTPAHLAQWAERSDLDFMVMDYRTGQEPYYPKPGTKTLEAFRLTFFNGRFAVYQRKG